MIVRHAKGLAAEFKQFALKGNVVELAIAVLVGTAFSAIVNSLATDILGPFIALMTNSVDFKTLSYELRPNLVIKYGAFLQALFNFVVIAGSVFLLFKIVRLFRRKE